MAPFNVAVSSSLRSDCRTAEPCTQEHGETHGWIRSVQGLYIISMIQRETLYTKNHKASYTDVSHDVT